MRQRLHAPVPGYEDLNDHQTLRHDAGLPTAASSSAAAIHRDSRGTYGVPRIHAELARTNPKTWLAHLSVKWASGSNLPVFLAIIRERRLQPKAPIGSSI